MHTNTPPAGRASQLGPQKRHSTSLTPIALVSSAAQEATTCVKLSGSSSLGIEAENRGREGELPC